ncbi:hypothetical protein BDQ17DRAFT_1305702 [Cyathus striatus]|nr:hypothetical protein BDQ17DRAFT_1305702 [Cyathus striatus]
MASLAGKVAIVTGSSRSIGAAIVKKLSEEGAKVIVNYVSNPAPAEEVVNAIKASGKGDAVAIKADASTLAGGRFLVDETIKVYGKIDILVCNAGFLGNNNLAQEDEETFDKAVNANFKGPLFLAKFAAEHLPSPGGRIIFLSSSLTANSTILPYTLTYVATKGAIEQITRVLAKDLGARGITVNAVSPGPVDTPMFREGKSEELIRTFQNLAPSKRLGQPEDIAPVVAFLASDAARWVNGQNVRANGGLTV